MPNNLIEVKVHKLPECDFCGETAEYDGRTKAGPWGYMCGECFKLYGTGLGLGKGQRLVLIEEGNPDSESND